VLKSSKRYTEEFKGAAVRQVTERGYGVSEVAAWLGTDESSRHRRTRLRLLQNAHDLTIAETPFFHAESPQFSYEKILLLNATAFGRITVGHHVNSP
jgi:transposase-like protein